MANLLDIETNLGRRMLVFVVDDDDGMLEVVGKSLDHQSVEVVKARDAKEFYSKLRKFYREGMMPDIILLDIMMPEISGCEVLEEMKKYSMTRPVPIILMTAMPYNALRRELSAEFDGLLLKPFTMAELIEEIGRVMNKKLENR